MSTSEAPSGYESAVAEEPLKIVEAPAKEPPPSEEVSPADREADADDKLPVEAFDPFRPKPGGRPVWAKPLPKGFAFPRGVHPIFLRFRAEWTTAPEKGERHCVVWELTDIEELAAAQRAMGQPGRSAQELAKQTIRIVDGHQADWSGNDDPGSIDNFWREIGPKCRQMLVVVYSRTHVMSEAERVDFLLNCIAARALG